MCMHNTILKFERKKADGHKTCVGFFGFVSKDSFAMTTCGLFVCSNLCLHVTVGLARSIGHRSEDFTLQLTHVAMAHITIY